MNKEKNVKKAFLWNMIGSACYSGSSFLYLMVVTRVCGTKLAGFYSLSYATAQLLLQVARYGVRTYQATDLRQKFLFKEYKVSRIITCALMMLFGIIYSSFSFTGDYIIISCFIILMKMIDAVEDVYHGNFQQKYHVELMGKMLAARNVYSAVFFTLSLVITKSLYFTCASTAITSLTLCLVMNSCFSRKSVAGLENSTADFQMGHVWELLKICTPLFVGTFLSLLLYNVPKYAMASVMSDEYQTYYSILFMPSFVITLMCEFVFKPLITTIAELWWENNIKKFVLYVLRIVGIILVCCSGIVVAGHLLGRTLLELIYGVDLSPYKLHFIVLLIGGGISAEVYMLYNILIAIRKGNCLLPVYSITAVLTILAARQMVKAWGIMGAALNYLLSCSILFVLFTSILVFVIIRRKNTAVKSTPQ
ncbi:lipopolysaccharide biosynthesis protein [Ruminococcus sp. 5_1_39BFAA]|uniref:lipopolysaccharide biosynthesis protein n=1 Tax=Ruminococcus sp. 5_1_39BFAA TaxID=457412 RepID=UPI003565CEA8